MATIWLILLYVLNVMLVTVLSAKKKTIVFSALKVIFYLQIQKYVVRVVLLIANIV